MKLFTLAFISGFIGFLVFPEPLTSWQYWVTICWMALLSVAAGE